VGLEWAANRITVTQEHTATAINDRVIAALAHHPASLPAVTAGRVTVACVDGEWHALPARLLAEVLRLRGWQVDFLGAQVPTPHLIAHLHHNGPDAVALSCSIPTRLPTAHAAITASQAVGATVLAGGAAFGPDGRYAYQLGADAWAPDARAAAERLGKGFPPVQVASRTSPSTTFRIWQTRSTRWSAAPRFSSSRAPSPNWRFASPECGRMTSLRASVPPKTSPI
jgi:methanogenic corrinoid protein MtbC1